MYHTAEVFIIKNLFRDTVCALNKIEMTVFIKQQH